MSRDDVWDDYDVKHQIESSLSDQEPEAESGKPNDDVADVVTYVTLSSQPEISLTTQQILC